MDHKLKGPMHRSMLPYEDQWWMGQIKTINESILKQRIQSKFQISTVIYPFNKLMLWPRVNKYFQ